MSGSIDTNLFDTFGLMMASGTPAAIVQTYVRDGVGLGEQVYPPRPRDVSGPTVRDFASLVLAEAAVAAYYDLVGTRVAVVDQFATAYTDVLIVSVSAVATQTVTGTARASATWTVRQ